MKQDVTLEQKESVDIVLMSVRCEICIYYINMYGCRVTDELGGDVEMASKLVFQEL